ncbi:MAG: DUF4250 domain-containing protein [Gemmiger sp.]|nr:DUF4250 domain-containing protein [Gemmiger sp.]
MLPSDPIILLSFLNTKLRDFYPSLDAFCKAEAADKATLCRAMAEIGYEYSAARNQFV